ncbi:myosin heavy chain, putative [Trypanosoma cruzi marinkellei]|uniref:Myosin heavy chain, putative n=1 Tax=Trypanosoma cruzi marinkellei TaxID=85056 RepID=K2N7G7_TRYCR|nr:myosin heavy chain, putative [Trypanosoma cruzi marinkellei]
MSDLQVFSSGDGGVIEMLEGYMERASLASGVEKDALERLSLSNKELAMLRSDFLIERDGMLREIELEKAEKTRILGQLEEAQKSLETLRNPCVVAPKENELSVLRQKLCELEEVVDVKNAHLETLNERLEGLVDELHDKREELIHVIGQLDDFVVKFEKAREGEKVAVEKLAARDQELFELERMHRELQTEHEQIVSHLQKQAEELRAQRSDDATAIEDLKSEVKGLRRSLQEAQAALGEKNEEINRLKEELIAQQEEAQALIDELVEERDQKSLEVSDSLKKLEEFVELMEDARKSEEEALQRSAEAERSLCRAQEELERLRPRQVEGRDNPKASELDTLRAAFDEACDMNEHAEEENKKLKMCVRLLTDALSKNQSRFTASSGVLEDACDALSNMQEG